MQLGGVGMQGTRLSLKRREHAARRWGTAGFKALPEQAGGGKDGRFYTSPEGSELVYVGLDDFSWEKDMEVEGSGGATGSGGGTASGHQQDSQEELDTQHGLVPWKVVKAKEGGGEKEGDEKKGDGIEEGWDEKEGDVIEEGWEEGEEEEMERDDWVDVAPRVTGEHQKKRALGHDQRCAA